MFSKTGGGNCGCIADKCQGNDKLKQITRSMSLFLINIKTRLWCVFTFQQVMKHCEMKYYMPPSLTCNVVALFRSFNTIGQAKYDVMKGGSTNLVRTFKWISLHLGQLRPGVLAKASTYPRAQGETIWNMPFYLFIYLYISKWAQWRSIKWILQTILNQVSVDVKLILIRRVSDSLKTIVCQGPHPEG